MRPDHHENAGNHGLTGRGADDFRGLRHLAARTGDDFIAGVVLYTGTQTLPFGPKMCAMPAATLWEI
jgi:hypothetical protein